MDRQARAAAHRLGQDLAALKQRHFHFLRFRSKEEATDALRSAFADCLRDDRIFHVLYFLLTILQLRAVEARKTVNLLDLFS
jgi:hypothetical protein